MNDILRRWTRLRNVDTLLVRKTQDGDLIVGTLRRKCQEWLENLSGQGTVQLGRLPLMPMRRMEIKQLLITKQNSDEADAIKYLAAEEGAQSVAGRIYRTWELDRKLIEDCH